jgi:uncharacterized protein (TIGR02246 family)
MLSCLVMSSDTQAQEAGAAANPAGATIAGGDSATATIPAHEQPFWDSAQAFVDAYANRDSAAIGDMFTEDAEFLDEFGVLTEGREGIRAMFAGVFEANQDALINEIQITRIRPLSETVAMEEGFVISSPATDAPRNRSRYVALHTKQSDGKWRINTLKDFPREPLGRQEQLSQLAWMVGDWVNEDQDSVVHTTCDWSPEGNYLLRSFTMQKYDGSELSGVQRIGWDPALKKLRSWTFDSEGGFFHGLWTQDGPRWLLNLAGVTSEGESVTATSVFTVIDAEMVTWNYRNLIVGGEVRGETEPIIMVRRPPATMQTSN